MVVPLNTYLYIVQHFSELSLLLHCYYGEFFFELCRSGIGTKQKQNESAATTATTTNIEATK